MKIKEKQLKTIQEQQTKLNDLLNRIGILEANKHGLLHEMAGVNQDIEDFKKVRNLLLTRLNLLKRMSHTKKWIILGIIWVFDPI